MVREDPREAERARVRRYAMVIEWSDFPGAHTHGRTRAAAAEMGEEIIALLLHGDTDPPAAWFTAMDYSVRPEAEVRELASAGRPG
jgi:hypothetical protein